MKYSLVYFLAIMLLYACNKEQAAGTKQIPNPAYDSAFSFLEKKQSDSAFFYFNTAKDIFLQNKNDFGAGKCLLNMAIISTDKGDYFGGQELSLHALKLFDSNDENQYVFLRSNYNNLGISTYKLKDYKNSLLFYDQAIKYSTDSLDIRICLNNKAKVYQEIKDYPSAIKIYLKVLSGVSKNPKEYARTLSNLANARWQQNPGYSAEETLQRALAIRVRNQDSWGMNASYAHLSEYHAAKSPERALDYARKMYVQAQKNKSVDDELFALQQMTRFSSNKDSKTYLRHYLLKQDSLLTVRNAAKNQFALIRYEAEKHKADNLGLQKDVQQKRFQIILLILGILIITIAAVLIYRKRKRKMAAQARNAIRESQLQTSKKVHDVVANGLYQVMTEIENQQIIDRAAILDKIEDLYEKSRDISYEKPLDTSEPFHELLATLIKSFSNEKVRIIIAGNDPEIWHKLNPHCCYEVSQIIQELLVNMKKHSAANHVLLRFSRQLDQIAIHYSDNGIGAEKDIIFGNGLRNTGNRIETIKGAIIFDPIKDRGLKIDISFPVS